MRFRLKGSFENDDPNGTPIFSPLIDDDMTVKEFRDKVRKHGVIDLHPFLGERSWYILTENIVIKGLMAKQLAMTELKRQGVLAKPIDLKIGNEKPIHLDGQILNFKRPK